MIRRTLQGLSFDIPSPSHLELVLPQPHLDRICIAFLGGTGLASEGGADWWLFHQDATGNVGTKRFDTRDDAVAMVAQAFQNAGAP